MATTFRFYINPDASAESEDHNVPFYGQDCPFYYTKLLETVPSGSYNTHQWITFAPGQESYPTNFFCDETGAGSKVYHKSAWITQSTDLEDALTAENCERFAAGTWRVAMYFVSGGAVPDTTYRCTFYVYLRNGSEETLLFNWTTATFGPSFSSPEIFDSPEQEAYDVSSGDQLVIKAYVEYVLDNGDALRHLMGNDAGDTYYGYVEFPGDAAAGVVDLATGWVVGNIETKDLSFKMEVRSRAQHLQQKMLQVYSPECRADLGDARCGVDLADSAQTFWYSGSVTEVTEDRLKFKDTNVPSSVPAEAFRFGLLTWLEPGSGESYTGDNHGIEMEVKSWDSSTGEFELFQAMPFEINVGDEFTVTYGCDKTLATCRDRFNNLVNFRGEPHVPGMDALDINRKYRGRRGGPGR